jgi:large subunit ribosomal protein L21
MYAIVKCSGKQIKFDIEPEKERYVKVDYLGGNVGDEVILNEILLISGTDQAIIGTPIIPNAQIICQIKAHGKEKKIVVFKYRPKNGEKTVRGHRQPYTLLTIKALKYGGEQHA